MISINGMETQDSSYYLGPNPDILGFPIPSFLSGLFVGISDRNDILGIQYWKYTLNNT